MIERLASYMLRRTLVPDDKLAAGGNREALAVNSLEQRWLRASREGIEPFPFLAHAFESCYVWDEHMVSVGNKQVRKPKKDGWYEHGQNCSEYLEVNFGSNPAKRAPKAEVSQPSRHFGENGWMA